MRWLAPGTLVLVVAGAVAALVIAIQPQYTGDNSCGRLLFNTRRGPPCGDRFVDRQVWLAVASMVVFAGLIVYVLPSPSRCRSVQGEHSVYVPRASLPTDEECAALFIAMEELDEPMWALAMRLKHRCGVRWGELVALQVDDIAFDPRVVHVRRAVEQGQRGGPRIKAPKNGKVRTTIFPKSLVDDLGEHIEQRRSEVGGSGLLFPGRRGEIMRRAGFQPLWVKAAARAVWPMTRPLERTAGYGKQGKGWRWKGSAKWSPHDLRHVAACWAARRPASTSFARNILVG